MWSATCTTRNNGREGKTLGGRRRPHHRGYKREEKPEEQEPRKAAPWVDDSLSKQDRHAFFLGTMKASLLIGAAYLVGFGVFILILTLLFR